LTLPVTEMGPESTDGTVGDAVTALFVPGDRSDRFAKAKAAGADAVIIDLEDAVLPDAKSRALAAVLEALAPSRRGEGFHALVRVNSTGSPTYNAEIEALLSLAERSGHGLRGLMVPKAEDPVALRQLSQKLPTGLALVPLIESAIGLVSALELAQVPGVTRLAFGAIDFALDINADDDDRFLDYARSQVVIASRAAGIAAPYDSPCTKIVDIARVAASARRARGFGFGGKLCIHPAQVSTVQVAFAPTIDEIEWAQSIVGTRGGATQYRGEMIDRPVTERAKRILRRAAKDQ